MTAQYKSFKGPALWARALKHLERHPDAGKQKPVKPVRKEIRDRETIRLEGFLRSKAFDCGMGLVEKILGEGSFVEIFTLDLTRSDEKVSVTYFLSRRGFQKASTSVGCSVSCSPATVTEAVNAWFLTEEHEYSSYPLIKMVLEIFNSFADPICDDYD